MLLVDPGSTFVDRSHSGDAPPQVASASIYRAMQPLDVALSVGQDDDQG